MSHLFHSTFSFLLPTLISIYFEALKFEVKIGIEIVLPMFRSFRGNLLLSTVCTHLYSSITYVIYTVDLEQGGN